MSEINSKWVIFNLQEWTHFKSVKFHKCFIAGRTFTPGETLYEEDEDEDEQGGSNQCLGEAPDIVVSTGGQLPTRGRSGIPRRTVRMLLFLFLINFPKNVFLFFVE